MYHYVTKHMPGVGCGSCKTHIVVVQYRQLFAHQAVGVLQPAALDVCSTRLASYDNSALLWPAQHGILQLRPSSKAESSCNQ